MFEIYKQKIEGIDPEHKENRIVFEYESYPELIKVSLSDSYFDAFITIYKRGAFDAKTKGRRILLLRKAIHADINYENMELDEKYNYKSVRKFIESNRTNEAKFSYLYKMSNYLLS